MKSNNIKNKFINKEMIKRFFKTKKYKFIIVSIVICGFILFIVTKTKDTPICIVQFETNGGSEILSQDVKCGEYANIPISPIKEGFSFESWYYYDDVFDFENTVINKNIILTAKWKVEEGTEIVKIHFDTDGGSKIDDIEISKGSKLVPPISPSKEGHIFTYWYYEENRFDFLTSIDKDITLKAGWEKEKVVNNDNNNSTTTNNKENDDSNNVNPSNKKCIYEMKDVNEYDGTPTWEFGYGEDTQIGSSFGFWNYEYEACKITYKTDNKNILTVNSSGIVTGKKIGTTNLYVCVVDKKTEKELDCFKWKANVDYVYDSKKAKTDSNNLLNAIDGYYWYLDGYKYAYIHANVIPWYDHECLDWSSEYIELIDNKFITSEDTGENYSSSSNIHNEFLVNPTEFAYDLISNYNMHVENNKLYITIGGKTYSFTKFETKKNIKPTLTLDKSEIIVDENEEFNIAATITPVFSYYSLTYETPWITTNNGGYVIASCNTSNNQKGKVIFNCKAIHEGKSTITIEDTTNGISKTLNITVNDVPINVSNVTLNKQQLNLLRGDSETLKFSITPTNAENKSVNWTSSNTNVATVNNNGTIVAKGKGTAIITVTTIDGGHQATCEVNVTNPSLTAKGSIGYTISTSSSGIYGGISATIKPSGGSGEYIYYYIKLYKDGELIKETTNTNLNEIIAYGHKNGIYTMEYVVKDSDGNEYKGTSGPTNISM